MPVKSKSYIVGSILHLVWMFIMLQNGDPEDGRVAIIRFQRDSAGVKGPTKSVSCRSFGIESAARILHLFSIRNGIHGCGMRPVEGLEGVRVWQPIMMCEQWSSGLTRGDA